MAIAEDGIPEQSIILIIKDAFVRLADKVRQP